MTSRPRPTATAALTVALAAALSLVACQNADDSTDPAADAPTTTVEPAVETEPAPDDTEADADTGAGIGVIDQAELDTLLDNVDEAYTKIDEVWPGYRPNEHPVVLGWKDDGGRLIGAVAINHPTPDGIGTASEIDATERFFDSAHLVTEIADDAADILQPMETFEFERTVGGADSFLMVAGGGDSFFDPTTKDYAATLLHEMFHRYQSKAFIGQGGAQDVEGYAYTPENLELAALEERALTVAVEADTDEEREVAARHAAAIRLARRAADDRVVLDDDQERFEGTARYIEHRLGGDDTGYVFKADNYAIGFVSDPSETPGVKDHYGFGRFYGSGAAVMKLLDDVGADDPTGKVQAGDYPMSLLATELGITEEEVDGLVAEARLRYDPNGELPDQAAAAAEQATNEGSVFGDDDAGSDSADGRGAETGQEIDGEGEPITDEELACLEENGVSLDEDGIEIPADAADACFGPIGG